jgi:hypothetical protein
LNVAFIRAESHAAHNERGQEMKKTAEKKNFTEEEKLRWIEICQEDFVNTAKLARECCEQIADVRKTHAGDIGAECLASAETALLAVEVQMLRDLAERDWEPYARAAWKEYTKVYIKKAA